MRGSIHVVSQYERFSGHARGCPVCSRLSERHTVGPEGSRHIGEYRHEQVLWASMACTRADVRAALQDSQAEVVARVHTGCYPASLGLDHDGVGGHGIGEGQFHLPVIRMPNHIILTSARTDQPFDPVNVLLRYILLRIPFAQMAIASTEDFFALFVSDADSLAVHILKSLVSLFGRRTPLPFRLLLGRHGLRYCGSGLRSGLSRVHGVSIRDVLGAMTYLTRLVLQSLPSRSRVWRLNVRQNSHVLRFRRISLTAPSSRQRRASGPG